MAQSVGEIGLDLVVNQKQFDKQMGGIQNLAKKTGKILASAFAIKELVKFSAECLELGSDLQEVQNVVDVTFPNMNKQVNEFAKNAASSFGLSETMAKKFTGTFGSMAKAFGFAEEDAYGMAKALTGLAGDVASFYNLSQEEAYTKLKSVFTGETESLKNLGVVMTQTALDSFALAKGFGKTTSAMSESEKVALRYAFVQEQLSAASGDFIRTSGSWANQVKVLTLQFDSFKASIGQGLINILTPAIQTINLLMAKLVQLGETFKNFTERFFGDAGTSDGLENAADSASDMSSGINAAEKSAKKLKNTLYGFDSLNVIPSSDEGTGTSTSAPAIDFDFGSAEESTNNATEGMGGAFSDFIKRIKEEIGNIDFSEIKENFKRSVEPIKSIASTTLEGVKIVFQSLGEFAASTFGNIGGIALQKFEIITGGVASFLEDNKENINKWVTEISNNIAGGFSNLKDAGNTISDALSKSLENAKPTLEAGLNDLLTGVTNFRANIGIVFSDAFEKVTKGIKDWTEENKLEIENFFTGFYNTAGQYTSLVGQAFQDMGESIASWWESDGSKTFSGILNVFEDIGSVFLRVWNENIYPIITTLGEELSRIWEENLKPLWDNILGLVSAIGDFFVMIYNVLIKPIMDNIVNNVWPTIKNIVSVFISIAGTLLSNVIDVISGIVRSLKGIINFITGVFTGDWEKAWNGIKDFIGGIWDGIWSGIKTNINLVIDGINLLIISIYTALRNVVNGVGGAIKIVGDMLGKDWGFSIPEDPPQIPKLAQGGYVKANTPRLAMIGDNKRYGEIVAPEDKMYDISYKAMADVMKMFMSQLASAKGNGQEVIKLVVSGDLAPLIRLLKVELDKESERTGRKFEVVLE